MRKLIDLDTAIDAVDKYKREHGYDYHACEIEDEIQALPSAQHEIIHCRECKYAHLTYGGDCKYCDKWLDDDGFNLTLYLDGDFYCGFAEMKEDE